MSKAAQPLPAYSGDALRHNAQVINYARGSLAAIAGASAGILGLLGWQGFIYYAIASTLLSGTFYVFHAKLNPTKYFVSTASVWVDEVVSNAVSFVLFWTLFYGLVHIYD
ncbi:Rab5-interacting protein-domain-containing protein, partial [Cladochytrium replicatum]